MTFAEFCKQVSKETKVPYPMIKDIMTAGVRVILEELLSNKENSEFDIKGLCNIYLSKKHIRMHMVSEKAVKEFDRWMIRFKPKSHLKQVINEDINIFDFTIGQGIPLYPEEYYKNHKLPPQKKSKAYQQFPAKYKVVDTNKKKRNRLKKKIVQQSILDKLPQEEE